MDERGRPRVAELMVPSVEVAHLHEALAVAADRMAAAGVGALPVVDGDELVGLITDRDIGRHQRDDQLDLEAVVIGDVVGPGVVHCFAEQSAAEVAAAMAACNVSHMPVLDADKKLVGIVARDDLPAPEGEGAARAEVGGASGGAAAHDPHPGLKVYSDKPQLKD